MNKTLILYVYCENQKSILANKDSSINLKYFLDNGLIKNDDYLFCINVNGEYEFDFKPYLDKYSNLKLFSANGRCSIEGRLNILKKIDYKDFNYFHLIISSISSIDLKLSGPINFFTILFSKTKKVSGTPNAPHSIAFVPSLSIKIFL